MILLFSLVIAHNNFLCSSNEFNEEFIININGNICISSLLWMKELSSYYRFNLSLYIPPKIELFLLQLQELNFTQSYSSEKIFNCFQNKNKWNQLFNFLFNNWFQLLSCSENQQNIFTSSLFEEVFQKIFNLYVYKIQQDGEKNKDFLEIECLENNPLQTSFWMNYIQSLLDTIILNRIKNQILGSTNMEFIEFNIIEKEYISFMIHLLLNHPIYSENNPFELCKLFFYF